VRSMGALPEVPEEALTVLTESRERVLLVTIARPEVHNAIDRSTSLRLREVFSAFAWDHVHRIAVLTGAGSDFCAGVDLAEARKLGPRSASGAIVFGGITRDFECHKPILAALHGSCLGGGLELALCADIRIADETTVLGLPESTWGFMPGGGGTQRLARSIPMAVAMEMVLTGDRIDAMRAERLGLVNRVVSTGEAVDATLALAARLAERPDLALRRAKEAVIRGMDLSLADGLRVEELLARTLTGSPDITEGLTAFAEKRTPQFRGTGAAENVDV